MGLDEAAKKVKSLPATVTAAMQIKTLHHHKKHRHGDNSALLQQEEEAKKKSIEAALDKAKLTLSNMMEETKEEMDKAILTCTAKQEGLAILESDLSVSMKVENMTSCDDVTPGSTTTLMQCGTGYSRRFQFAGSAAQEYAQLKTK